MFEKRVLCFALVAVAVEAAIIAGPLSGQDVPKKSGSVPITFVPPPMENATYSVGIYDVKTGKLARRLCEAAGQNTFTIGLNGLITSWDGKDDDGKPLPPGRYAARGYAVGPLKVEGEAILGNDWAAEDENLRVQRVEKIAYVPEDDGLGAVFYAGEEKWVVARFKGSDGSLVWQKPAPPLIVSAAGAGVMASGTLVASNGRLILTTMTNSGEVYRIADGEADPTAWTKDTAGELDPKSYGITSPGKDGTLWKIEEGVLCQYARTGERLRSLPPKEGEPIPKMVAASPRADRLYVVERKQGWQRVRGLSWVETKEESGKPVSTWQTFFERNIRPADPALGLEDAATAKAPSPTVEVVLAENPLAPGKRENAKITATFDAKGSYLSTADGLRLRRISERTHLRAVKLVNVEKSLTFYQTDGAAWDEFSIKGIKEIASFDAGEFEINEAGEKPNAEKAPDPDL